MAICVNCVSYVRSREWIICIPFVIHRCAHPKCMEFDYVEGKAKLAYCWVENKNGDCEYFIPLDGGRVSE